MLRKAAKYSFIGKSVLVSVVNRFSSPSLAERMKIGDLNFLTYQSLRKMLKGEDQYYVNKIDPLCRFMNSDKCVSIFRPRRMGKSTMISDLAFLYKNSNINLYYFHRLINFIF